MAPKLPQKRKSEDVRNERGRFTPGNSANPGGQPQWRRQFMEAFGKRCAPLAEEVLWRVLNRKDEHGAPDPDITTDHQLRAAEDVLLYVLPKPKQEVSVEGELKSPFAGLTPQQLVAIATGKPTEEA